jgi:hypothetical protein
MQTTTRGRRYLFPFSIFLITLVGCSLMSGTYPVEAIGKQNSPSSTASWEHLSSSRGDLPAPGESREQTASLLLDIDQDGILDIVIGIRKSPPPSMVWYRLEGNAWVKYLIDDTPLDIEAGGTFADIDGDGDLDIVMGGDYSSNRIWWWENPYPNFDPNTPWVRREIKNSGDNKHHDQMFGDFDGDGQVELVFWNQGARTLFLAEIPPDPRSTQPWEYFPIYSWNDGVEHEGLAQADIDGDGLVDIIGGGRWFKYQGGTEFTPNIIDDEQRFSRAAAGQLKEGGSPEVVFVVGDGVGRLKWYEQVGGTWIGTDLLGHDVDHGHSLEIADINGDGHLDIFAAEMRLDGGNEDAKMWIFEGNGNGDFQTIEVATGFGNHESRVGDIDGDGTLDILGKPYNWESPRIDIWLNKAGSSTNPWERHVIDDSRPWTSIFITAADVNGDGLPDIITGGWWYQNPGQPGGDWIRHTIGAPLNNMAVVYDFDRDGDLDILGTAGQGSDANSEFYWAQNDGAGTFTILDNIPAGDGDFLQGAVAAEFTDSQIGVALSWHASGKGIQMLTVPQDPSTSEWGWSRISPHSQDEALSVGDIDGDGRLDLLLGTQWLKNEGNQNWALFTLHPSSGMPDRNILADMNNNGKLDAIVGYEAISEAGKLAWYEQGASAVDMWTEHIIADTTVIGPMSLDVADIDGDGDLDIVVGEHHTSQPERARLLIFENEDGFGTSWIQHEVYTGDEHHDGAQLVDMDGDGDLDIISIGWTHARVILYENVSFLPSRQVGTPQPPAGEIAPTETPEPHTAPVSSPTPTPFAAPTESVENETPSPTENPIRNDGNSLATNSTPLIIGLLIMSMVIVAMSYVFVSKKPPRS